MIYVPPFITANLRRGKLRGRLSAYVLLCEIANFSRLSATLQKKGKTGAEELASLLDTVFQELPGEVEIHGGLITRLYGDSFWALFPASEPRRLLAALDSLQDVARSIRSEQLEQGRIAPRIRLVLGYGRINWQIFPNELQYEYTFFGPELDKMEVLERGTRSLILTSNAAERLRHLGLLDSRGRPARSGEPASIPSRDQTSEADRSLARKFKHPRISNLKPEPDFRQAVCICVRLTWDDPILFRQVIQDMELIAITFGIYVSHVQNSGNEYLAMTWTGVPRKDVNAAYKACRVALDAIKPYPGLRHGIASGTVFSGIVGGERFGHYVVCGPVAERAKQLCALTHPGETITDRWIHKEMSDQFSFQPLAKSLVPKTLKGSGLFRLTGMPALGRIRSGCVFVGREPELDRLENLIRTGIESGKNQVVHVCGEPGIGKTRLAAKILSQLPASDCRVFELWCDLSSPPLEPVRQLFRQLFPLDPESDPQQAASEFSALWKQWAGDNAELQKLGSQVGAILGLQMPGSLLELTPPELRLDKIFEAGALTLKRLAARQPVLIHLDDLQWIDAQSRRFFESLGALVPGGICILATSRHLDDGSVPALQPAGFASQRIDLGPLDKTDVLELHRTLLGVDILPPASVEIIQRKHSGNPFAIEQVIALCLEQGMVNARGEFDLPGDWERYDLQDVLLFRIGHLSAKTRECVDSASVLGMRFNIRVLSQMLNSDARRELANGFRNRIWGDLGEVFYIFSHALIQEAAYSRILRGELSKLHLSAAQAMETVFELELDDHAEEIAQHYEKAGHPDKAAHYYDRAADRNWDGSFFDRTERNYRKAIALSSQSPGKNSLEHCEHLFHLALLYHYLLRYQEAEPLYLEVRQLAQKIHGPGSNALSPYLNNLGRFYKDTGRYAKGEKLLKQSLAIERELNPISSNVADRINNLGHLHSIRKQYAKAEAMFLEALEIMEKNYDPGHFFTGTVCGNLGGVYYHKGQLAKARKMLNRALEIGQHCWGPEHPVTAIYLTNLGDVHRALKHYVKAENLYQKALANLSGPFGKHHPKTLSVVSLLQALADERGNREKAEFYWRWLVQAKASDASS